MSRCTVTWWQEARDELARLWLSTSDKSAITLAANTIDRILSDDPIGNSTPGHEGFHQLEVHPLRVQFAVSELDRLVQVWSVRMTREE